MTCYMDVASGGQTTKRASHENCEVTKKVSRTGSTIAGYYLNVNFINQRLTKKKIEAHCQTIVPCVVIKIIIIGDNFLKKRIIKRSRRNISSRVISIFRANKKSSLSLTRPNLINSSLAHSNKQPCRGVRLLGGG